MRLKVSRANGKRTRCGFMRSAVILAVRLSGCSSHKDPTRYFSKNSRECAFVYFNTQQDGWNVNTALDTAYARQSCGAGDIKIRVEAQ
jgi:hypothetical protein